MSEFFDFDGLPEPTAGNPFVCNTPRPTMVGEEVEGMMTEVFREEEDRQPTAEPVVTSGVGHYQIEDEFSTQDGQWIPDNPTPGTSALAMFRESRPELLPQSSSRPQVES